MLTACIEQCFLKFELFDDNTHYFSIKTRLWLKIDIDGKSIMLYKLKLSFLFLISPYCYNFLLNMLTVSDMSITHSGSLCPPPFSVSFSLLSSPTLPTNPLLKSLSFVLRSTEFKQGCLCRLELGTVPWSLLSLPMTTQLKKKTAFLQGSTKRT